MIIEKYTPTELIEVEDLDSTERGAGGFGSTGVEAKIANTKKILQEAEGLNAQQEEKKE